MKEYPIGTRYSNGGKHPKVCTVIDILKTYNYKGELVKTRYVSTHDVLGQVVTSYDVPSVSIARGLIE